MANRLGQLGLPPNPAAALPLLHRAATFASTTTPQPAYVYARSLTSSIADALARSDSKSFSPNLSSVDDPAPTSCSCPGQVGIGDTRRSKSPSLLPGAAPAAIQAWDGGMAAGIEEHQIVSESNDYAMSVMSANEQAMSIAGLSDRQTSHESVGGMPYDRDEEPEDSKSNEIVL